VVEIIKNVVMEKCCDEDFEDHYEDDEQKEEARGTKIDNCSTTHYEQSDNEECDAVKKNTL